MISSNVFEFLSACYLGVVEEGESLVKTPFQKLISEKRSLAGIKIVSITSIITYLIFLIIGFVLKNQIIWLNNFVKGFAWIILISICLHLIIKEKNSKLALLFFCVSGLLGVITFNLELNDPFLPLLTGLFGLSSLIKMKKDDNDIPEQMKKVVINSSFFDLIKASFLGILSSIVMAIIPSMSPSQVGLISEDINSIKKNRNELKIASMTSINISDNLLSLIALISIGKGRSGVVEKIGELIELSTNNYFIILFLGFLACVISSFLLIKFAELFSKKINLLNNKIMRNIILFFVFGLTFSINGFYGLLILFASTIIGYYCNKYLVSRTHLLGSLVIPTVLFYLSF